MFEIEKIFSSGAGDALNTALAYRDGKNISAFGLCSFGKAAITALCANKAHSGVDDGPLLIVAGDFYLARAFYEQLKCLLPDVELLPARDDTLVYRDALSGENVLTRLKTLKDIVTGRAKTVVCCAEALMQIYPDRDAFLSHCMTVEKGRSYDLDAIVSMLVEAGYKREPQLTDVGRFSLRGDILDVWSVGEEYPVRIEFFGDEVEKIRFFDAENQLSKEDASSAEISPATEFFATKERAEQIACAITEEASAVSLQPDYSVKAKELSSALAARVRSGDRNIALGFLLPLAANCDLYSFGGFTGAVYDEVKQIYDNALLHSSEHANRFATLLSRGETLPFALNQLINPERAFSFKGRKLAFQSVMNANRIFAPDAVFSFKTIETPAYYRDFRVLKTDLGNWLSRGYTAYLCAWGEGLKASVKQFLSDNGIMYSEGYGDGGIRLIGDRTEKGCVFHNEKIAVVGTADLSFKSPKKTMKRNKRDVFSELKAGDYVVHEIHGIGLFEGTVKLEVGGARRDYLLVSYAGGDKLYVPVENMDSLSAYAADGGVPSLSKIGGADFARVKEKVRKSVKELAINLLELYKDRFEGKGHRYSDDDSLLHEFEDSFEFTETDDQITAVEEGLRDLKSGKIMDRLLCGDVGYGKTEVALRLAFKVIAEGKQVAFLSPTTILAKQHFETVKKRMEPFGIKAGRLTRFDTKEEQAKTVESVRAGKTDIVVGTHRLLSKDVDFADLGLLILDEEQRFGVADKEKIKDLKRGVNVLTLSATPIPRTLHMSLVGIRDISVLDTPPTQRVPVQTYVMEYGETLVTDAVTREINRGGQVFIVYNRVADIDRFAARIQSLVPSAKVAFAHGQMREEVLERTVENFVEGKTDVLVSSTIIENGIDIARANTMIVVDADRLGLSQLYQLRGRVGRSNRLAYVFFTFDGRKTLTDTAYQRLEAITQFTEFGSGFKIAMRDLEIRGAGSVLGAQQHGHLEKVGYDMYCRLLSEAVDELRGEKTVSHKEVTVITDYGLYLPDGYVTDKEWRLRIYARAAKIRTLAQRDAILKDMADVYGPVPEPVKNLVDVALIKNLAAGIGADKVILKRGESAVQFCKIMDIDNAVNSAATAYGARLIAENASLRFQSHSKLLKFLLKCTELNR